MKSENSGLPVELRMLTVQCNRFGQHQRASSKTSLSSESGRKGQGVNLALLIIGRKYVTLEEKQMEILRIAIVEKKDAVLPAGFGKWLVRL